MRTQFMGVGLLGKSPNVTAQTRKNIYLEFKPKGDKTQVAAYPTPGLELFADFGSTACRAHFAKDDYDYVIHRGTFWEINNAGVQTSRGTLLTTTGRCAVSDNGLEIMIVDGQYGYIYTIATNVFAQIVHADFPANPETVTFEGGYFMVSCAASGQFNISALYDGMTWDALDFATAESNPDNILRVEQDHGDIVIFGEFSTEYWGNTGGLDSPFSRISGANLEWGLAAKWSVTKFTNSLMFLGRNRMGESKVISLNGYNPTPVSTPDLEAIINSASVTSATALSYLIDGHPMYQLNLPSHNRSFLFDGSTNVWSELTGSAGRHRGEIGVSYLSNRYVTDYDDGKVYKLKRDVYSDNGTPIVRELTGRHFEIGTDWFTVNRFVLDIEAGVGLSSGQGSNPQVMLQYSVDNGHTWSEELWTAIGAAGEYQTRVEWWRLGRFRDAIFKITLSDPVKFVIAGAGINTGK